MHLAKTTIASGNFDSHIINYFARRRIDARAFTTLECTSKSTFSWPKFSALHRAERFSLWDADAAALSVPRQKRFVTWRTARVGGNAEIAASSVLCAKRLVTGTRGRAVCARAADRSILQETFALDI